MHEQKKVGKASGKKTKGMHEQKKLECESGKKEQRKAGAESRRSFIQKRRNDLHRNHTKQRPTVKFIAHRIKRFFQEIGIQQYAQFLPVTRDQFTVSHCSQITL